MSHLNATVCRVAAVGVGAARAIPVFDIMSPEITRAACRVPNDSKVVYGRMNQAGLQYGPQFRRLRNIHGNATSATASIEVHGSHKLSSGYNIHPAVLDNAFQLGAVIEEDGVAADETFVPASVELFVLSEPIRTGDTVLAMSAAKSDQYTEGTVRDHRLLTARGDTVMSLKGLLAKPLNSAAGRSPRSLSTIT